MRQLRYETGLTIRQMLFDGFAAASEVSRQEARVGAAARRVRETSEFTALVAAEAYLESFRQRELVGLAGGNIAAHLNTLELVTIKAEGGAASLTDVEQTQSRVSTAEDALVETRSRVRDADANYINTIGEAPVDLVRPVVPFQALPENEEAAVALALKLNPTIAVTRADLETAKADYQSTRAGFWPRVDLEVGANSNRNLEGTRGQSSDVTALVVMRYNIFNGGADTARRQAFIARIAEARQRMLQVQRATEREMRLAWNALVTARERLRALRRQVQANESVLGAYQLQFDIGRRDLLDLLDSENDFYRSQNNLLTAEIVELFGVYRVLATAGMLLATLDLSPPRESLTALEEQRLLELEETLRTMTKFSDEETEEDDGTAPVLDPNAPLLDPNAPVLDPNAPVLDPNAPILDPNAPLLDPDAPILDPEAEPESGRKVPVPADSGIASVPNVQSAPLLEGSLTDLPKTLSGPPISETVEEPILWVKRARPSGNAEGDATSETRVAGPRESPAAAQLAKRSSANFVDFTGLEGNRQSKDDVLPPSGLVLHKLPSDLLEFEFAEPATSSVAMSPTTDKVKVPPQLATGAVGVGVTKPARSSNVVRDQPIGIFAPDMPEVVLTTPAHDDRRKIDAMSAFDTIAKADPATPVQPPDLSRPTVANGRPPTGYNSLAQVQTAIPEADRMVSDIEADNEPPQIARLEQPFADIAAIPAAAAFGMGAGAGDQPTKRVDTEPAVNTAEPLPAQVASLTPPQSPEAGHAGERWFVDGAPRAAPLPDTGVETEVPASKLAVPIKPIALLSGKDPGSVGSSAKPTSRTERLVAAASPEELMPDRYGSTAASSSALPPIVPYGFFDLDRRLVGREAHILLPARPTRATDTSYTAPNRFSRQSVAPFLENPIKASAVAALIPSGRPDPQSTTHRYPFWSFE